MSRFRRRIVGSFRAAPAALSLAAALVVAAGWAGNRWYSYEVGAEDWRGGGRVLREASVRSVGGRLVFFAVSDRAPADAAKSRSTGGGGDEPAGGTFLFLGRHPVPRPPATAYAGEPNRFGFGFKFDRSAGVPGQSGARLEAVVPAWAVLPVLLFPPVRRAGRWAVERRRRRRGQCEACGYDLRATVGRCPECGRDSSGPARAPAAPAVPGR